MGREPRRHAGFPPHARPRAGQPVAGQVRRGPRARTGRWLATGLVAVGGLAAGCGSAASPPAFRPAGVTAPDRTGTAGGRRAHRTAGALDRPPFGGNVHIVMPGWLPADRSEVPAVSAAKNFLLAFLYAEYRGNQDNRWTSFVSGPVLSALRADLSVPSVTTESFTGTIIFSHLRAYPDPTTAWRH